MLRSFIRRATAIGRDIAPNAGDFVASRQPLLWLAALVTGIAVGIGAILFRLAIGAFQLPWLGTMSEAVASRAATLPVVEPADLSVIVGSAGQLAALRVFNKGLVDQSEEAHR